MFCLMWEICSFSVWNSNIMMMFDRETETASVVFCIYTYIRLKVFYGFMWKCAFHLHIAAISCKSFCLNAFSLLQYHSTMLVLYCKVNIKMKAKRINENFEVKTTLPFINAMAFMRNNWSNFMKCGYRRRRNSSMHNNIYIKI